MKMKMKMKMKIGDGDDGDVTIKSWYHQSDQKLEHEFHYYMAQTDASARYVRTVDFDRNYSRSFYAS
jgi:hypothetical protein